MSPAASMSAGARAAVFAPLSPVGRADLVTRRLADAISVGLLRDDEQLPSEADLAVRLGVAPVTVREALTSLREQGLVRTRRGRGGGSFVCAPADPASAVVRVRLGDLGIGELRDLADHYAAISGTCARLAAERADAHDQERLAAGTRALAAADGVGARRRAEGQFHLELAVAAQSPRLTREEVALQSAIAPILWLPYAAADATATACERHVAVQVAVAAGDGAHARAAAEQHVSDLLTAVRDLRRQVVRT